MAYIVASTTSLAGTDFNACFQACDSAGDTFINNGVTYVIIKNSGASNETVTINGALKSCNFGIIDHIHDESFSVPAGTTIWSGPFDQVRHNTLAGFVELYYSNAGNLSISVMNP
jgi:hypothetical protein